MLSLCTDMLRICVALICFLRGLSALDHCPIGWIQFENACYFFSKNKLSWADSVVFCQAINGRLADVRSQAEKTFLVAELKKRHTFPSDSMYWLAGTDQPMEGVWEWITTGEIIDYSDWYPGEPNNSGSHSEDCLTMWGGTDFKWNDAHCEDIDPFICKVRLQEPEVAIG